MKTCAILCAAGKGTRFGGNTPKQFLFLKGKMIIEYSLEVFEKSHFIDGVVLLVPQGFEDIARYLKDKFSKVIFWDYGGNERADTVKRGLEILKGECDIVAIHDAARPFITLELLEKLIADVETHFAVAPGVLANDTVKFVVDGHIQNTLPRSNICLIQTPQVFKFDLIYRGYEMFKNELFTDDLQYVERLGIKPKIIENSRINFKITTKEDLLIAEAIVEKGYW
ncbi:2-C-methyl-D-erythritol 4-phosphate cytidylyltransferase [Caldicellulosiruptor kronotskyensis 2002]|uniref:2-C-methyl-D-erythritol 4-phosphate cytidylyltransferase n=1 Tax=Caldicellulosiruptor kronotskyensis (strain DSM 18902 / VKM B-2412 / 2002) TaxID=632348 RepID=E4SBD0_CALK2|nr:2-C-methyl-D-erythritol 4-phosphate cytidylyltransferase [Caldicellulosiruptor kronotskyensis]ADQ46053.1 2-C-methyl-D-erythritol 4-phosphate cytidylyltransferase [Caldicellulosiruptor kronotskyensis 2002]